MEQINLLVIDTTSGSLKLAIKIDDKILHKSVKNNMHIENLIPTIEAMFKAINYPINVINYIGVCCGPGSFTGIRIGIATAKSLAFSGNINCFGFSSIGIYNFLNQTAENTLIIPLIDAKKQRFFCSFINNIQSYSDPNIFDLTPAEINKKIEELNPQKIIFTGSDFALIKEELKVNCPYQWFYQENFSANDMLEYSLYLIKNKHLITPSPIYIRKSEAEIALLNKQKLS